ncbi:unnamed protein product [Amoebophrya sp. A25]|nr:unnamed protein product [Amoebophrya sp. A25]|eukprot:GSA25T00025176001.1
MEDDLLAPEDGPEDELAAFFEGCEPDEEDLADTAALFAAPPNGEGEQEQNGTTSGQAPPLLTGSFTSGGSSSSTAGAGARPPAGKENAVVATGNGQKRNSKAAAGGATSSGRGGGHKKRVPPKAGAAGSGASSSTSGKNVMKRPASSGGAEDDFVAGGGASSTSSRRRRKGGDQADTVGNENALAIVDPRGVEKPWAGQMDESLPLQAQREEHLKNTATGNSFSLHSSISNTVQKPKTAFELFVEENCVDNEQAAWTVCTDKERYEELARQDKTRYEEELNVAHGVKEDGLFSLILLAGQKKQGEESGDAEKGSNAKEPDAAADFDALLGGSDGIGMQDSSEGSGPAARRDQLAMLNPPALGSAVDGDESGQAPQVRLDEDGNIILDDAIQQDNQMDLHRAGAALIPTSGNKKSNRGVNARSMRWSEEETERFYNAVRAFGFDLVLIGSVFPSRNAAQIKSKYNQEMKKNGEKMNDAFNDRTDSRTFFEVQTGKKIDESQHWVAPALPAGDSALALENAAAGDGINGQIRSLADRPADFSFGAPVPALGANAFNDLDANEPPRGAHRQRGASKPRISLPGAARLGAGNANNNFNAPPAPPPDETSQLMDELFGS